MGRHAVTSELPAQVAEENQQLWWVGREFPEFEHLRPQVTEMLEDWRDEGSAPDELVDWLFAMLTVTRHGLPKELT